MGMSPESTHHVNVSLLDDTWIRSWMPRDTQPFKKVDLLCHEIGIGRRIETEELKLIEGAVDPLESIVIEPCTRK